MLKKISEYFTYTLLKLEHGTHLADAVDFFIYDTIKIFLLLSIIIFVVSIIRSYFPPEKTKRILSHKKVFMGYILAALLGVVTPFCSCSALLKCCWSYSHSLCPSGKRGKYGYSACLHDGSNSIVVSRNDNPEEGLEDSTPRCICRNNDCDHYSRRLSF